MEVLGPGIYRKPVLSGKPGKMNQAAPGTVSPVAAIPSPSQSVLALLDT